jgi:hypothetical protein
MSSKVEDKNSPFFSKTLLLTSSSSSFKGSPLKVVNLPMTSACYSLIPFVISSALTSDQGSLSSLSIEEQTVLNKSLLHPAYLIIASSIFLWLTLTKNSFTFSPSSISCIIARTSASGIIASYFPAISKSH